MVIFEDSLKGIKATMMYSNFCYYFTLISLFVTDLYSAFNYYCEIWETIGVHMLKKLHFIFFFWKNIFVVIKEPHQIA